MDILIKTQRVYGVSNEYVDSYISRDDVDADFVNGLESNKHIVVYGSSKQGKSSLIRQHILEDRKIEIECSPRTTIIDIYKSLLRQLNVVIEESTSTTKGREIGGKVTAKAKLKIPFFGSGDAEAEGSALGTSEKTKNFKNVEYDLSLPQDISEVVAQCNFKGRIVIENFHYLPMHVQQDLSYDLRTFEDKNILFVILGIWRERNRLTQFNGDLVDRIIEVPVEPWEKDDFINVIKEGEPILNVSFEKISENLIKNANNSIGVLQELCKYSCLRAGVTQTNHNDTVILEQKHLDEAINIKVGDYSSRHMRCLEEFVSGDDTKLNLPYFFLKVILESDIEDLESGLRKADIENIINKLQDKDKITRQTDYNRFFNNLVDYQLKRHISPPLFDFDKGGQKIKIIDSTFIFFIRHKNRKELMDCFCKPN